MSSQKHLNVLLQIVRYQIFVKEYPFDVSGVFEEEVEVIRPGWIMSGAYQQLLQGG